MCATVGTKAFPQGDNYQENDTDIMIMVHYVVFSFFLADVLSNSTIRTYDVNFGHILKPDCLLILLVTQFIHFLVCTFKLGYFPVKFRFVFSVYLLFYSKKFPKDRNLKEFNRESTKAEPMFKAAFHPTL